MSHLRITIGELRLLIREQVDRLVRRSAGFGGEAGIAGRGRGSIELPPISLGDEERQEEETHGEQQVKCQFSVRVDSRRAGTSRQT